MVAVDVTPSPVGGAGDGTAFTCKVAEAETPLEQLISGLNVPGAEARRQDHGGDEHVLLAGGLHRIWSASPSWVPERVAEFAGLAELCEEQLTWNVVDVPGVRVRENINGLARDPAWPVSAAGHRPPRWPRPDLPSQPRM